MIARFLVALVHMMEICLQLGKPSVFVAIRSFNSNVDRLGVYTLLKVLHMPFDVGITCVLLINYLYMLPVSIWRGKLKNGIVFVCLLFQFS